MSYVLGSRGSALALAQTHLVRAQLAEEIGVSAESLRVSTIATAGDKVLDMALQKIGEKDLWTKELEVALAARQVDLVVHSLKDVPTRLPGGMTLGAILEREDPADVIVFAPRHPRGTTLASLPAGSVLGTSSLRRSAQLRNRFPGLQCAVVVRAIFTCLFFFFAGSTLN